MAMIGLVRVGKGRTMERAGAWRGGEKGGRMAVSALCRRRTIAGATAGVAWKTGGGRGVEGKRTLGKTETTLCSGEVERWRGAGQAFGLRRTAAGETGRVAG